MKSLVLRPLVLSIVLLVAVPVSAASARGGLDPTFGDGGRVVRAQTSGGAGGEFSDLAQAPDGRIFALFNSTVMAFLPNGETDAGFGSGGFVPIDPASVRTVPGAIAIDSRGRLVVAGSTESPREPESIVTPTKLVLTRLLPTGQLDPSFGTGGVLTTDLGLPPARPYYPRERGAVSVTPRGVEVDGLDRILVTGARVTGVGPYVRSGPVVEYEGFVARIQPDGALDETFGQGGTVAGFAKPSELGIVEVYASGGLLLSNGVGGYDAFLLRLDPNGGPDPAFGSAGWRRLPERTSQVTAGEGGVFITQESYEDGIRGVAIRHLLRGGSLDRRFGKAGVLRLRFANAAWMSGIVSDGGGGVFLAATWLRPEGKHGGARQGPILAHVLPGGKADRRYGRVRTGFGLNTTARLTLQAVDSRSRPLLAGYVNSPMLEPQRGLAIARYRPAD